MTMITLPPDGDVEVIPAQHQFLWILIEQRSTFSLLTEFFFLSLCLSSFFCTADQPSVSSCDVLVVPVGHSSMSRAIHVVQKLWSAGVSADITYDVSQVSHVRPASSLQ